MPGPITGVVGSKNARCAVSYAPAIFKTPRKGWSTFLKATELLERAKAANPVFHGCRSLSANVISHSSNTQIMNLEAARFTPQTATRYDLRSDAHLQDNAFSRSGGPRRGLRASAVNRYRAALAAPTALHNIHGRCGHCRRDDCRQMEL